MSRTKRTSFTLEEARKRLAGLQSINPVPVLGPNTTVPAYNAAIDAFAEMVSAYNENLSALDKAQDELNRSEKTLADHSQRILAAVRAQFGPDSDEYKQAGGIRRSDRKRPVRNSARASLTQPSAN